MSKLPLPPESERRTQARVSAQIPIQLHVEGESIPHRATLIDLSWGGALCQLTEPLPPAGQPIRLRLPWSPGETIEIETTPLRHKALDDGRHLLALRFQRLSLANQGRLEKLLGELRTRNPQNHLRDPLPLVATLEVWIQTPEEWDQALAQIAKGQLRISTQAEFTPGQGLGLQFDNVPARARLRLRARVLACDDSPLPLHASKILTLEFEHPKNTLRYWAEWLRRQIQPGGDPFSASSAGRSPVPPDEIIPARLFVAEGERSALEISFPEALDYLMLAWGDVNAFESVFYQLILSDSDTDRSWTPEAWAELQFLQELHDRAYGVSKTRLNPLKPGREVF
ncbi:MAG: PilZ domain-containing protein [Thermochromatium sp.]